MRTKAQNHVLSLITFFTILSLIFIFCANTIFVCSAGNRLVIFDIAYITTICIVLILIVQYFYLRAQEQNKSLSNNSKLNITKEPSHI
ncbi:MAG: hypothetical protein ACFFHD_02400 [Promethearchaeota archaeon]